MEIASKNEYNLEFFTLNTILDRHCWFTLSTPPFAILSLDQNVSLP